MGSGGSDGGLDRAGNEVGWEGLDRGGEYGVRQGSRIRGNMVGHGGMGLDRTGNEVGWGDWMGEMRLDRVGNGIGQGEHGGTVKNNEANGWMLRWMRGVLGRIGGRMLEWRRRCSSGKGGRGDEGGVGADGGGMWDRTRGVWADGGYWGRQRGVGRDWRCLS